MTTNRLREIYTALSAPFPAESVERSSGATTGKGYDTTGIKAQSVVDRLNEILGVGCWRVASHQISIREGLSPKGRKLFEGICELVLQLGEWREGQWLTSAEALGFGGHTALSETDAHKGAYTNAIKRTAAFFGVGREAYAGTIDEDSVPPPVGARIASTVRQTQRTTRASQGARPSQSAAPTNSPIVQGPATKNEKENEKKPAAPTPRPAENHNEEILIWRERFAGAANEFGLRAAGAMLQKAFPDGHPVRKEVRADFARRLAELQKGGAR